MTVRIDPTWYAVLQEEFTQTYFTAIKDYLLHEKENNKTIFPLGSDIFRAFDLTPFDKVNVVILGQDPYHGPGQAHGLSFSVPDGVKQPPSLQNIFKEISADLGLTMSYSGNLTLWAKQGVLLLNAFLTVRAHEPASHQTIGWEYFTDAVIRAISTKKEHVVFLLRGSFAQSKTSLIDQHKHLILQAPHPSPLSAYRGFLGCKHFSQTNTYLIHHGLPAINWQI